MTTYLSRLFSPLACAFFPLCIALVLIAPALSRAAEPVAQSVVVKLRADAQPAKFLSSVQNTGARTQSFFAQASKKEKTLAINSPSYKALQRYIVVTPEAGMSAERMVELLQARGDVEVAELNAVRHIESAEGGGTAVLSGTDRSSEQWALATVQAQKAWKKATGKGIIVGIVDTGIDFTHPEFAGQLHINTPEDINGSGAFEAWPFTEKRDGVSGDLDGKDDDGNGYADDVIGYDFVDNTLANFGDAQNRDAVPLDEHGHGTNVAGVIAARNDSNGTTGLAYNSRLLALRAFDALGNGEDDDFAAAIVYGALNGAKVINLSFGDVYLPTILSDAIAFAHDLGCVIVGSSGNSGNTRAHYPSDFSQVISVGASTQADALFQTSNHGSLVDLVAPGAKVLTTTRDNSYASVNGTSFSAPHVAATAAMLLELRPTLTPVEIRGILTATTDDLGKRGWDMDFGAGRLNAAAALDLTADAAILISFPPLDYLVAKTTTGTLDVRGSVFAPFFLSYTVDIATEQNSGEDTTWTTVATSSKQIHDSVIASIPTSQLENGTCVVRVRVVQSNGTALERRQRFNVSDAAPAYTLFTQANAWWNDKRVVVLSTRTNHTTRMIVRFRPKGSAEPYSAKTEIDHFTHSHTMVFGDEIPAGVLFEATAIAITANGDSAKTDFEFRREDIALPRSTVQSLDYTLPAGFLMNKTADIYGDGSACVVVGSNEATKSITRVLSFENNRFRVRDSVERLWIPRDFGDSNGDGIAELFAQFGPRSALFQQKNSQLFGNRLFSDDTDTSDFWASTMVDLDDDGRDELIGRTTTSYKVYSFVGGKYQLRATSSPSLPAPDPAGQVAIGDFDGDGKKELCYGSSRGGIVILEYRGDSFTTEYTNTNENFDGNYFITPADVDNDGKKEILLCSYRGTAFNSDREYDTPLWSFRLLRATAANTYEVLWQDYSYGVRPPNPYRSGVAAGNIDSKPGDELIILAFPNAFVLTWNNNLKRMEPLWYNPAAISNTAVVHDFNGNGIAEFGFVTTDQTEFFEYIDNANQRPAAPTGVEGYATGATEVLLNWKPVPQAQHYIVFGGKITGGTVETVEQLGTTATTSISLAQLEPETEYLFVVKTFSNEFPQPESVFSGEAVVFTHALVSPVRVEVVDNASLHVHFSGHIPEKPIESSVFTVDGVSPSTSIPAGDHSAVLRFSQPLPAGPLVLHIASFRDRYNSPTVAGELAFDIPVVDTTPELYITSVRVAGPTTIELSFSEPVDAASASHIDAYELSPIGRVVSAAPLSTAPETVRIELDPAVPLRALGRNYVIITSDLEAASGHLLTTGPGKAIGFAIEAPGVDEAYAYPNPVRLSEEATLFFGNLKYGAEVVVRTLEGGILATVKETDGNGGVEWDCRDTSGKLVGSGVYIYSVRITDSSGATTESEMKKFAVVR